MSDPVIVEAIADGVIRVTLNRPDAANSRNQAMRDALLETYASVAREGTTRCLILTGAGNRHFCAGMDLKEARAAEPVAATRERLALARDIEELARLPIPTIAAINGVALGGGLEMALACDLRYIADEAQVGLPEVSGGLVPAGGATRRLPALVGPAKAAELIYLGDRLSGSDAEDVGLVSKSLPAGQLAGFAEGVARRIATADRDALVAAKRLLRLGGGTDLGIEAELDALVLLLAKRREVGQQ